MALAVILNILKIIGIVLASIIGFVLILVLLLLFVPVRYALDFERTGIEDDPPIVVKAWASWLLHILHVSVYYPQNKQRYVVIRIFGIPIVKIPLTEEEQKKKEEKLKKKEEKEAKKDADDSTDEPPSDENESGEEETVNESEETGISAEENAAETEESDISEGSDQADADDESETAGEEPRKSIFSRIREKINNIAYTIRNTYDKIIDSLENFEKKLNDLSDNIHYYRIILESELFERTFEKCKKKLIRFLKEIKPRVFEIDLEVGFEDPYTTGEVLAIAGMLYPVIGRNVRIYSNFEDEVIRGHGRIRGRKFIITIVTLFIWYKTDKDLNKLIRLFKKEPPKEKKRRSGNG